MRYRRAFVPGGTWFFTLVTNKRRREFTAHSRIDTLRRAVRNVRTTYPFHLDAVVILPDHLHAVMTLPPGDWDFALRWRLIKTWYTKHRPTGHDGQVWQKRYWEHLVRDERDLAHHVDYIHYNPVKHGYVERPMDWPWSSLPRFVRRGDLPEDWGGSGVDLPPEVGHE